MPKEGIYLSIDRRSDGQLQMSIGEQGADGSGTGYRIAGPKYDGSGKTLLKHFITPRDKEEILLYLSQGTHGQRSQEEK